MVTVQARRPVQPLYIHFLLQATLSSEALHPIMGLLHSWWAWPTLAVRRDLGRVQHYKVAEKTRELSSSAGG